MKEKGFWHGFWKVLLIIGTGFLIFLFTKKPKDVPTIGNSDTQIEVNVKPEAELVKKIDLRKQNKEKGK